MRTLMITSAILFLTCTGMGAIKTQAIEYEHGDTVLEGYLAYDDAQTGNRPGILVVHEWWGLNDYPKRRAEQLAELGYVAFALDMYGKGVVAKTMEEAGAQAGKIRGDRQLARSRAQAGLDVLKQQVNVDPNKIAVIGYCFGGLVALELARSGADIDGVVAFHASLNTPNPDDAKNIKGRVLVLHGAADPNVPQEEVAAFEKAMTEAKVNYRVIQYEGAVHAFTNPAAGNDPAKGAAYNELADKESWIEMKSFLTDVLK